MLRYQKLFILCSITIFCLSQGDCAQNFYLSNVFDYHLHEIKNEFYNILPADDTIVYTEVPRGLILSIDEAEFFYSGSYGIKPSGARLLDRISFVLKNYDNKCVIESHTDEILPENSLYKHDWELSIARANAVADYLVKNGKIKTERIFPLGFGEMMPFRENVSQNGFSDRRVDFVIFDYDIRR